MAHSASAPLSSRQKPLAFLQKHWGSVWFWGCLAVLLFFMAWRMTALLDSDMAGELILSRLLAQEHGILSKNWFYSTELKAASPQLIYTPLFFLTQNWRVVRLVGSFLQLLCYLLSFYYLLHSIDFQRFFPVCAAVLLLPLSESYFSYYLFGGYYYCNMIALFLNFGMVFKLCKAPSVRTRRLLLVGLAVVSLLMGLNGLRQLMIVYGPLVLAGLWLCWRKTRTEDGMVAPADWARERTLLGGALYCLPFYGIGCLYNMAVLAKQYHFKSVSTIYYIGLVNYRFEALFNGLLDNFGYQTPGSEYSLFSPRFLVSNALCFVLIFLTVVSLVDILRHRNRYGFGIYALAVLFLSGFVVFLLIYLFTSMPFNARYTTPVTLLCIPLDVAYLAQLRRPRMYRVCVCTALVLALTLSAACFYQANRKVYSAPGALEAAEFLEAADYTEGYATFWNANVMTELTNGVLDVWCWQPSDESAAPEDAPIYPWLQKTAHMDAPPQGRLFVLFQKSELAQYPLCQTLDASHRIYESNTYIAYGYENYEQLVQDAAS